MNKIILLLCMLFVGSPVFAGLLEGREHFNNERYVQAFNELKPLADTGDAQAQYYIGYMYLRGYGDVGQDSQKALAYLQQAAMGKDDSAQALLGFLYAEGKLVPQDMSKAIELYEQAAKQRNSSALLNLGIAYYTGESVKKDIKKAISYFTQIRLTDQPAAGRYLGKIYLYEQSVLNPELARKYYTDAAREGDLDSYYELAYMNQKGLAGTENKEEAIKLFEYAASKNHVRSQYVLGLMYANGDGVPVDRIKGYAWLLIAADQKLAAVEEAQKIIATNLTLSDLDKARQESVEIRRTIINNIPPPIEPIIRQTADPNDDADADSNMVKPVQSTRPPRPVRRRH